MDQAAFERDGALRFKRQLSVADIEALRALADARIGSRPGVRLADEPRLTVLLAPDGTVGAIAASLTSPATRPVRAVMFDKTPEANWVVAWHQDRTIAVRERAEVDGFGPWSDKDGILHVAPPFDVLARMITVRVHLDRVDELNAPLRIALGTHVRGRVPAADAEAVASAASQTVCLADAGDIWACRTPILHASDRTRRASRRRVLQVDYADFDLPGGLTWKGLLADD
ncbi:phytanoyl-CoA dioxygenase family protein [Brevundimonas sp. UBA7664]|uniref:phytanoyl-CoA dioxygenase family protein n=1 Tax=Brevundimonas sp. UBA7664 TaxID=1946141 RepID=UPI0032E4D411